MVANVGKCWSELCGVPCLDDKTVHAVAPRGNHLGLSAIRVSQFAVTLRDPETEPVSEKRQKIGAIAVGCNHVERLSNQKGAVRLFR